MASQVRGGVGVGVRRAHLVGSMPASCRQHARRLGGGSHAARGQAARPGARLPARRRDRGAPELGPRHDRGLPTHPDLRLVKDGDWSDYDKTPRFALQPGHWPGFAHEDQDEATQFRIREMIEGAVGCPVDVSASCGLGRRQPDAARAAMDRIKLLLD